MNHLQSKPLLSVVIPCSNSQKTLEQCLKSVRESSLQSYELIIVDDGSVDKTIKIAKQYADKVYKNKSQKGRVGAREYGTQKARSDILVNIDSDVIIKPGSLKIIADAFRKNSNLDAITGLLSKKNSYTNFASVYKNLYMHYYFSQLPKKITFLYGSIYAIKKDSFIQKQNYTAKVADDTENGQALNYDNKNIQLLKNLEVVHLKKYTLLSLCKNDFIIPYEWAKIFIKYKGWKQLGKNGTGFAHASREQLVSLLLTPTILFLFLTNTLVTLYILLFIWFLLNARFFHFLKREKNTAFAIKGIGFTFLDHLVMICGIAQGTVISFLNKI